MNGSLLPQGSPSTSAFRQYCQRPFVHSRRHCSSVTVSAKSSKRLKYSHSDKQSRGEPLFVRVEADGSDTWRLDTIVNMLKTGAVGIVPTDSYPAIVCDIDNKQAVERLYTIKGLDPKKQLSILCRHLQDISTYTLGFPVSNQPGQADIFRMARQVLPGPYTFILTASKQLPKQCTDYQSGKTKQRKSVGVRLADDAILQAILSELDRPLLCSSAHVVEHDELEIPEAAVLMDQFVGQGLDFIVDAGHEQRVAEGSTVIDMTGSEPVLVRGGKGDASLFVPDLVAV